MTTFTDLTSAGPGFVTRAQFLDSGYRDRDIRAAVRAGLITRIRHGVYTDATTFAQLSPEGRHLLIARSVADKLGPGIAISHQSACAAHGIAMFGHELDRIHVTRLDGATGRTEHGLVHHVGRAVPDEDVVEIDGMPVIRPARAVFETATTGTVESAIVAMDSAMRQRLASREELIALGGRMWNWQGARRARYALSMADERAESPGESRSRFLFRRKQLPIPGLQVEIFDEHGNLIGRADFAWLEYRHLGEFDGLVKFGGVPGDPRTPQQIAFAEKIREDAMRRQPFGMSRWVWAELGPHRQDRTVERIAAELEQSRRLFTRNGVVIPLG
jgi:hypothetical protein